LPRTNVLPRTSVAGERGPSCPVVRSVGRLSYEETPMTGPIITLIIQAIAGAIGGNAISGIVKNIDLGPLGKTISGAIGGGLGGQILAALIPALGGAAAGGAVTGSGFDIGVFAGQLAGGGITGAIVTFVVGLVKNAIFKPKAG
jgi:hypothetical protein